MVRIAWGGGSEKMWEGSISVDHGSISQPRPLGIEADEPGSMWLSEGRLMVRQRSPRAFDGVDLIVTAPADAKLADAKLIVKLTAAGSSEHGASIEIPLANLSAEFHNRELDKQQNRLLVRRAPGDALLFRTSRSSLVFAPGEVLHGEVLPHMLPLPTDAGVQVRMQLLDGEQRASWSSIAEIRGGPDPIPVELTLPEAEGVYDLVITAQQKAAWPRALRNSLQWKRPAIERRVQLVVVAPQRPATKGVQQMSQVLEIDPAGSRWWENVKVPRWPRFSRGWTGPLGNGMRETIHQTLGDMSRLKPNAASPDVSWEAYPLGIGSPGRPHVLEVDYPSNVPQTLGISIIETNAAGTIVPISLDSGIEVSDEAASIAEPRWEHHRLVFWPHTSSPLVLVTNRRQQLPAVYGKIRVLTAGEHLSSDGSLSPLAASPVSHPDQRSMIAYLDRPLLPENFSADEVLDTWSGRTLQDWRTFHQAGTRLVEYLHYAGYNGLMLTVAADGSAIYPSQVLEATPRYDTGVFFASGQDPMPKDVLEMLLRLMDRENMQLIPSIEFAAPLPALEAIRHRGGKGAEGLEWIGGDGNTWRQTYSTRRGLAPYYNTLDPRVQDAMLAAVRELITRYAGHASFRSLALRLSAYGYAQLPGPEWGMDDATIARFEADAGIKVPGDGDSRFTARAAFLLSDEHRPRWLQWRADQCHKFYLRVQEILAAARPDMPLYLAGAEMLAGPDMEAEFRPGLLKPASFSSVLLHSGIDPALYRDDAKVILLRSERIVAAAPLTAQPIELELSQSPEADTFFRGLPQSGSLFFHPPLESRVPSFDQKVAIKSSGVLLLSQIVPSAAENRRRFAASLAGHDSQCIIDGGWMLPLGQEEATRAFASAYRKLPRAHFADAEESRAGQPVIIRSVTQQGKTFAYAVNTTPFPIRAKVHVTATSNCQIKSLAAAEKPDELASDGDGLAWSFALEPYGLTAATFSEPDAKLSRPEATLPDHAAQWIAGRIRELGVRAAVLRAPPALQVLENADFQAKPTAAEPVPGWAISKRQGISITTDTTQGRAADDGPDGRVAQSAKISSDGPVACLVSRPFAPPHTGRLAISVWLKVSDAAQQPNLRLAVEAQRAGRDYYRFAPIGQLVPGQAASPIDTVWRRFIVPFNDLPSDGVTQIRVRLDLMGAGQVWADDVELFDLAFNESELRAFYKLLTLADVALQNGDAGESLRLLHGYWPRFLDENVPVPRPVSAVAVKPAAEPPTADAAPAAASTQSSGWADRVKGLLPERLR